MDPLQQAALLYDELDSLRPFSKDDEQRIMQKFRLDWNYHSNHLEGNQLTYGETKALLLFNITAQGKPLKDHLEMTGHNEAINWIIEVLKEERPLSESFIRQIHKLLLKEPYEVKAITPEGKETTRTVQVGQYKSVPNHVKTKTGEIFRFATPEETPAMMNDLLTWYEKEKSTKDKNAIILASEFHYKFIRIHPFDDGNGRLARILMNFILMSNGYPPVVIKSEDKENYFNVLQLADAGQLTPFVEYITTNLIHSLELMIRGAKGEDIEEEDDLEKEISLLDLKIASLGNRVRKLKNLEDILNFYDHSIKSLYKRLIEKSSIFDKYYLESEARIWIDNVGSGDSGLISHQQNRDYLTHDSSRKEFVSLQYEFKKPVEPLLAGFYHTSSIPIKFEKSYISIPYLVEGESLRLLYGEDLSEKQIHELVRRELVTHKKHLEFELANRSPNED